ncbi:MAG: TerC family protein [Bacteroidota bacterium]
MHELIHQITADPLASSLVILNLILIESLLSVDNAAVLGTMVMKLPPDQRKRALKYGIFGAYIFRGLCLLLASILVKIWWLKAVGGLYLLYLAVNWLRVRNSKPEDETVITKPKKESWLYRSTVGRVGNFWATVISVELMDLAFSLDNVFAAVAFSKNILLILTGVFIGILAMRFVAQGFVKLMERYPFLEACAYAVIAILGFKLSISFYEHFHPEHPFTKAMTSHVADWITSALTLGIFFIPVLTSRLFNFPKRKEE